MRRTVVASDISDSCTGGSCCAALRTSWQCVSSLDAVGATSITLAGAEMKTLPSTGRCDRLNSLRDRSVQLAQSPCWSWRSSSGPTEHCASPSPHQGRQAVSNAVRPLSPMHRTPACPPLMLTASSSRHSGHDAYLRACSLITPRELLPQLFPCQPIAGSRHIRVISFHCWCLSADRAVHFTAVLQCRALRANTPASLQVIDTKRIKTVDAGGTGGGTLRYLGRWLGLAASCSGTDD